jgi:hypothetical protein
MIRLLSALLCLPVFAADDFKPLDWERTKGERPSLREPGVDRALLKDETPERFFAKRRESAACVEKLDAAEKSHRDARKALRELVAKKAPQDEVAKAEEEWTKARRALLPVVEECGPCVTRPVEYERIRGVSGTEHWYIADGSCWVGKPNEFERTSSDFEKLSRYPRRTDGFAPVLAFAAYDKDGKPIPADQRLPTEDAKDPTFVFLALRADTGVGLTLAWSHLFQSEFRRHDEGRHLVLRSPRKDVTVPEIPEPELTDVALSGKTSKVQSFRVRQALGAWFITRDGYVRYYNAGDFGAPVLMLDREGRRLVQDVLYEVVERLRGE